MTDAALQQWLELARTALAAPEADFLAGSPALVARRAQLVESLSAHPGPVSAALAQELRECESALQERLLCHVATLRAQLVAAREGRAAAHGYQQPRPNTAAFVSRQV
jgi:hypothetical protein